MLRIAGLRINPNTNGQHRQPYFVKLTLKSSAMEKRRRSRSRPDAKLISPQWSPDGKYHRGRQYHADGRRAVVRRHRDREGVEG